MEKTSNIFPLSLTINLIIKAADYQRNWQMKFASLLVNTVNIPANFKKALNASLRPNS